MYVRALLSLLAVLGSSIDFSDAQACGGDLNNQQGMVLSPTYRTHRRYGNNLNCVWNMHFTEYDIITIGFRDLQMENGGTCRKDYLEIAFSDKPSEKVCGFQVPRKQFTGAGPANLTFVSDARVVYRGFYIQYRVQGTPCKSLPCQNGGTCENVPAEENENGYKCICLENFEGINCENEIVVEPEEPTKYCESAPCQNSGTCTEVDGGYECQCVSGWEGNDCENDVDECASNPCQNDGTCENLSNEYSCKCVAGWSGVNCEEDVDECSSNPCQNQGTCENLSNEYRSQCAAGWRGTNCEEDIDECLSNPCKNQGTCQNLANEYRCQCADGWTGVTCKEDVNECASNPCRNGGTCQDLLNRYSCRCMRGWTGVNCEEDEDNCIPNPCKNRGVCRDAFNDFRCTCKDPWTGKTCEEKVEVEEKEEVKEPEKEVIVKEPDNDDPCNPSPCFNEAECVDLGDGDVYCMCQEGFSGDFCEEGSNVCIPNPCQNEGTCIKWGESFTCTCASGWDGDECSKNIDECASNPCPDDLVCVDKVNSYICREECDPGYTGEECDVEINECDSEPCKNDAVCKDEINAFSCECKIGYSGLLCDVSNPCEEEPCKNGGTCHENPSAGRNATAFICACQLGWTGTTCEEIVEHGCPNPEESGGGLVPYGISLEFFCGDGFKLSGPGVITCQETGEFTSPVPECIATDASATVVNISARTLKSPMVMSMLVAGGLIVVAIVAFLLYLFVCAPWNSSSDESSA